MIRVLILALLATAALAGCSSPACNGPAPTVKLQEGYCPAGEADRCYYDHNPADGF
jgi:hypothetical protein